MTMRPPIKITQNDIAVRDHALDIVCQACGDVTPEEVMSRNRSRRVSFARHLAMYLLLPKVGMTVGKVGLLYDRDHATVVHATQVIDTLRSLPSVYVRENEIINQAKALHTSWV